VHVEIKETTKSITMVILSIRKPNSTENEPISNHVNAACFLKLGSAFKIIETNIIIDKISVIEIAPIETQSPSLGSFLPKNIWTTNASSGRKRIKRE
tara:strand:- start:1972 stop:2262 length:291 start_codon:yes stop_codon:yes gene_type:complete